MSRSNEPVLLLSFINFVCLFDLVFFVLVQLVLEKLLLDFSANHLETVHSCFTWSEDVYDFGAILPLSVSNFLHFFNLVF